MRNRGRRRAGLQARPPLPVLQLIPPKGRRQKTKRSPLLLTQSDRFGFLCNFATCPFFIYGKTHFSGKAAPVHTKSQFGLARGQNGNSLRTKPTDSQPLKKKRSGLHYALSTSRCVANFHLANNLVHPSSLLSAQEGGAPRAKEPSARPQISLERDSVLVGD